MLEAPAKEQPTPARPLAAALERAESVPTLGEEARALTRLAVPVVLTQLGMVLMSVVDSMIVGHALGKVELGGVALGNSIFFTVTLFAMGIILAIDPLVAQRHGAGERPRTGSLLWQANWIAAILAIPMTWLFLEPQVLMRWLDQPPDTAAAANEYLRGRAWNVPTMLVFAAHRGFLNGVGNTIATFVAAALGNVVNLVLVAALVLGWIPGLGAMGVYGAGLGTSVAGLAMLLVLIAAVHGGAYAEHAIAPRRPAWDEIGRILKLGLPIGGMITAEIGVFTAAAVFLGQLGPATLAAHHTALQLASLTFMVPLGISAAASIRVGHAVGRGDQAGVVRTAKMGYALGVGFMGTTALAFALFPGRLAQLFTTDPEVVALAVTLIQIAALFQLSDGAQAVGAGCLRGAGDAGAAFVANLLGHWAVGFPVGYLLAFRAGVGAPGMWLGLTASLTIVAILLGLRFLHKVRAGIRRAE